MGDDGKGSLFRGAGADTRFGGALNDSLGGEAGGDLLSGGDGADQFVLTSAGGYDHIADFNMTLNNRQTTDQLDVSDRRRANHDPITYRDVVVTDTNGDGSGDAILSFPGGESVVLEGVSPDEARGAQNMNRMGLPCYVAGRRLHTPEGWRAMESRRFGDRGITRQGAAVPILWAGRRHLDCAGLIQRSGLSPTRIPAGVLGNARAALVSPQHAVLMHLADEGCVLVRTTNLAQAGQAADAWRAACAAYHPLLLPAHAVLSADGAARESLCPGRMALGALTMNPQIEVTAAVFALRGIQGHFVTGLAPVA